jgi:tripartite-type tricarboxylate transporter receptor subunit TctC
MNIRKTLTTWMTAAVAAACCSGAARAEPAFPLRPITLVVPYAPGGTTDILARLIAMGMGQVLKQPVVVDNTSGAGGTIGTQRVVRANPDGYTLTFGNMGSLSANSLLYPSAKFNPMRDLAPVGLVATVPTVLSVSNASGVQTLPQLIDALKMRPGSFNFGSGGPGTTNHLAAAMFLYQTGTKAEIIQYRGAGPAIAELMSGQIQVVIDQTLSLVPMHTDKRVRAVAVANPTRIAAAPDIPTFSEGGLPSFDLSVWNAISAPPGTPKDVIDKLAAAISSALDSPEVAAKLKQYSARAPVGDERGPRALGQLIESDTKRLAVVIKAAGIATN